MGFLSYGYKGLKGAGQAINKTKTNVPTTEIGKKLRDLKIATQKSKGSLAKLKQTAFELKNNKPMTFKKSSKKSESNTEAYKRIQGENTKVIKGILDKATGKKDGGRMGYKSGTNMVKRKTNVEKIKETFAPKKNVPSNLKGFSKLPEKVQQQMNKKLAKKV
tara:strand:+ start:43 stop:528 length:486 start_codon:yes stop_codon:yes gene_type:complete